MGVRPKRKFVLFEFIFHHAKFEFFGALEVPFPYFTRLDQFEYWRNFEILKKGLYRLLG
jgi:hypothetical protein